MSNNHLFLCAVGRSGTTILRTSLGLHPQIYYNNRENNVVQDLLSVAEANCTLQSRQYAMVVEQPRYDEIFRKTIADLIWPDHQLRQRTTHMAAINPTGDQLDYLCQLFPEAKILCLVRNGIEVVASRMRYASFSANEFSSHCNVWVRSQSVFKWGQANPERFQLIRHEWFYDSDQITQGLHRLYDCLGIPPFPGVADNILGKLRHPTEVDADSSVDFGRLNSEEKVAYFQAKGDRWRDWNDSQKQIFESICSDFMDELGYSMPWSISSS